MSIRIEHGGVTYFCESPEEAVALGRLLAAPANGRGRSLSESGTRSNGQSGHAAAITDLIRDLNDGPKRLLRLVVDAPNNEMRSNQLLVSLQADPSAFGGYLAAITRAARRKQIEPKSFFQRLKRVSSEGDVEIFKIPHHAKEQVCAGLDTPIEGSGA